jgi:hypothetical protein
MHSRLRRVRLDVRELPQAAGVVRDFAYTAEKLIPTYYVSNKKKPPPSQVAAQSSIPTS